MTREEFCEKCRYLRQNVTKVSLNEVWRRIDSQPTSTKRLEKGANNFNMSNAISYLDAIDVRLVLVKLKKRIVINKYEDIIEWLKQSRKGLFTQQEIADKIKCNIKTIVLTENGKTIATIDTFLKLVEALEYEIILETK